MCGVEGDAFFSFSGHLQGTNVAESLYPRASLCRFRLECGIERVDGEELGVFAWGRGWVRECMIPQLYLLPGVEIDIGEQVWDP
jgi:hypothetical protein